MGHPMMHHFSADDGDDWTGMFYVPIPMAMFGVLVSFMFGATVGAMIGRKHAAMGHGGGMMGHGGHGMMGHGGGMMAWKQAMAMKHHHHGDGPGCCCGQAPEEDLGDSVEEMLP